MKERMLHELSDFFKLFSDYTRLRILCFLTNKEANVGEIVNKLELSQSLVSHQLKHLKDANFVKSKRAGKKVVYDIADEHIRIVLKYAIEHIKEGESHEKD